MWFATFTKSISPSWICQARFNWRRSNKCFKTMRYPLARWLFVVAPWTCKPFAKPLCWPWKVNATTFAVWAKPWLRKTCAACCPRIEKHTICNQAWATMVCSMAGVGSPKFIRSYVTWFDRHINVWCENRNFSWWLALQIEKNRIPLRGYAYRRHHELHEVRCA